MKRLCMIFLMVIGFTAVFAFADGVAPSPSASPLAVAAQAAAPVLQSAPAWMPPQWIQDLLNYVQKLPKVGPFVAGFLMWLSILGVALTALSTAALVVFKGLAKGLDAAKMTALSDKVEAFYNKFSPYLQYLSMYNAKLPDKKKDEPKA